MKLQLEGMVHFNSSFGEFALFVLNFFLQSYFSGFWENLGQNFFFLVFGLKKTKKTKPSAFNFFLFLSLFIFYNITKHLLRKNKKKNKIKSSKFSSKFFFKKTFSTSENTLKANQTKQKSVAKSVKESLQKGI